MDNNYVLSTFNDQFTEFIEDIERVFPNNIDIKTCKNALISIRKAHGTVRRISRKNWSPAWSQFDHFMTGSMKIRTNS